MDQTIQHFLEQFGALGGGWLMFIENAFSPIPSEIVMPWAGYAVSQGGYRSRQSSTHQSFRS